ncbi:MAG: preprotein translocase subunit SecG [Thermoanaerobaculia bacterium]|nr:preprotein translocase subunit SecG [Thermoanaerobaculia bacterium]
MIFLLYLLHVIVCIFLILVVLFQQGKGADLSVFGGGSTQTAFGARSATNVLHKLTVASFVMFIVTTMTIVMLTRGGGSSVIDDEPAVPETATTPAPTATEPPTAPATTPATGATDSAAPAAEAPATPPQ